MPDFTVTRMGTDSSGRSIYATAYMAAWWAAVCDELGFAPVVTQGAFMARNGGGAAASAGYHDQAGTFDLRVWNLTDTQVAATISALRRNGAAAWLRNFKHGGFSDPHIHLVLGSDQPLSSGAAYQWRDYLGGGDGMGGRDYHPRPTPLVHEPPADLMEDTMRPEDFDHIRALIREEVEAGIAKAGDLVKLENPNGVGAKWSLNTTLKSIWTRSGK